MAAVDFGDISEAFETVSFNPQYDKEAYLCRETGRIYYYFSDLDDSGDELPEDIGDDRKYIQIPRKNELDLGRKLVFRFVEHELPGDVDYVYGIFRKAGAYSKFKALLERRGTLEKWYEYEANATEKALREWCEVNSIDLKKDSPLPGEGGERLP
ncbi:MAG: hypothetical protein OXN26_08010 [Gammaproteobacteria bacterium]|nr:hypothetical protein [Gammaproteobacteria bacterium]